jgi:hypothetical protein
MTPEGKFVETPNGKFVEAPGGRFVVTPGGRLVDTPGDTFVLEFPGAPGPIFEGGGGTGAAARPAQTAYVSANTLTITHVVFFISL